MKTRSRSLLIPFLIFFGFLVVDQLTKFLAEKLLTVGGEPIPLVGEFIQLRLHYNPGAAFSSLTGHTWILSILSFLLLIVLLWAFFRTENRNWQLVLALLASGALGNLIDRWFRDPSFLQGHVVDFIDYGPFIGNVADIAIVVGAVLLALLVAFDVPFTNRNSVAEVPASSEEKESPANDKTELDTKAGE